MWEVEDRGKRQSTNQYNLGNDGRINSNRFACDEEGHWTRASITVMYILHGPRSCEIFRSDKPFWATKLQFPWNGSKWAVAFFKLTSRSVTRLNRRCEEVQTTRTWSYGITYPKVSLVSQNDHPQLILLPRHWRCSQHQVFLSFTRSGRIRPRILSCFRYQVPLTIMPNFYLLRCLQGIHWVCSLSRLWRTRTSMLHEWDQHFRRRYASYERTERRKASSEDPKSRGKDWSHALGQEVFHKIYVVLGVFTHVSRPCSNMPLVRSIVVVLGNSWVLRNHSVTCRINVRSAACVENKILKFSRRIN